ncbi:MAG TPA: POTRA domain-containing protein, partial [Steroidobacteraceae bacterium]|nr:POTRA domain-containing protein [Steroidobacteraceae bacterium]
MWVALAAAPAEASAEAATAAAENAGEAQPKFDVMEYRVVGNTVLQVRDIERVLYPLLGTSKTFADVEVARKALEDFYHTEGYGTAFVDIPPQTIHSGIVRLHVTEGRIESTLIGGARYFPERDVIAKLTAATPGTVLQLSKLQEQLGAVNTQTPDRSVVPVLKAGSAPGTVDLSLKVNDTLPLHGSIELNNQATLDTRSLRTVLNLSYNEMFGRLDSLALQYQFTPQQVDQVRVWGVNYLAQAFDSGLQPSLSYVNSNSNVPTPGALGVLGIGEITSAKLGYPLLTSAVSMQSISVEADYKHFRNLINQNATTALDTPITYLNLSAAYSGLWHADLHTTTFTAVVNAGPRHLVGSQSAFENDRYKGRANYFDVRADFATTLKLPAGAALRLRAAGQGATDPLITNEDYSLAGIDGVRGYLEAEELVDKGAKGTIQLISPGVRWRDFVLGDVYTFFDAGRGSIIDPLTEQPGSFRLRSWGFGLDLLPGRK